MTSKSIKRNEDIEFINNLLQDWVVGRTITTLEMSSTKTVLFFQLADIAKIDNTLETALVIYSDWIVEHRNIPELQHSLSDFTKSFKLEPRVNEYYAPTMLLPLLIDCEISSVSVENDGILNLVTYNGFVVKVGNFSRELNIEETWLVVASEDIFNEDLYSLNNEMCILADDRGVYGYSK
jgi:hypothetical protein